MQYGNTYRPAYPGYMTQSYRIGDHSYSSGGSEAQRPPNLATARKLPHQWLTEHKQESAFSMAGQGLGMTDRASARATNAQTDFAASVANGRSTAAIANKLAVTDGLKNELEAEAAATAAEMGLLEGCMDATMASIESKKKPLDAVAAWYAKRGTRYATERLCDPVKHDLEVMTQTLKESVRLLESALSAQQSEHMRLQVKKAALEADIVDKTNGLAIDAGAKAISVDNRPVTAPVPVAGARLSHPPMLSVLHAPYDPKMWQISSKTICDEARKVVQVSKRLRDTSTSLIAKREAAELEVYQDLVRDYANSIAAIKQVISQTEDQIAACEGEMGAIDSQVGSNQSAFAAKQAALAVTNERLVLRATRPARELVQDPAQRALGNELAELKLASRLIEGNAGKLMVDKSKLGATVGVLKETVELKTHFLGIEYAGEECMATLQDLVANSASALPPTAAFHSSFARPVTALPATRLSVSRVFATR